MRKKQMKGLLLVAVLGLSSWLFGQESHTRFVGVEMAYYSISYDDIDHSFIRKNAGTTYLSNETGLFAMSHSGHMGVKYERLLKNPRFGVLAGIRYTYMHNALEAGGGYGMSDDYVLFYHQSTDNTKEFYRLTSIYENSGFLSVPLAFRFSPIKHPSGKFEAYAKLTFQLNVNVHNSRNVNFYDSQMSIYADDVIDKFEKPCPFSGLGFLSHGIRFGNIEKVSVAIEVILPAFKVFGDMSGLFNSSAGGGVQLTLQKKL